MKFEHIDTTEGQTETIVMLNSMDSAILLAAARHFKSDNGLAPGVDRYSEFFAKDRIPTFKTRESEVLGMLGDIVKGYTQHLEIQDNVPAVHLERLLGHGRAMAQQLEGEASRAFDADRDILALTMDLDL